MYATVFFSEPLYTICNNIEYYYDAKVGACYMNWTILWHNCTTIDYLIMVNDVTVVRWREQDVMPVL